MHDGDVLIGFDDRTVNLRLDQIIPVKPLTAALKNSQKYKRILSSMKEVGIIEPPVVTRESHKSNLYVLLDGHLRIEALRTTGVHDVQCLISKDDEAFTYNKHINRLSTVQEHKMILRAIKRGVPEEKIAQALSVDVASIVRKRNLLEGICPEATELLKDKIIPIGVFQLLKKMKPFRQMQAATLMNDANSYSITYARLLLASTPKEELVNPEKPKKVRGLTEEQMARMENEMAHLEREYKLAEDRYSTDVLNLTLTKGYLKKLLGNVRVVRYLAQNHSEILSQFQKITDMSSLAEAINKDLAGSSANMP